MKYCDINVFMLITSSFQERVFLRGGTDYHVCIPETGIIISPLPLKPTTNRKRRGIPGGHTTVLSS
jgi:hypothetical protein